MGDASKQKQWVMLAAAMAIGVGFAISFSDKIPPDAPVYLYSWVDHLIANGPIGSFAKPFSNYSPPFLYLLSAGTLLHPWLTPLAILKLVAAACHALMAVAAYRLARAAMPERAIAAAAVAIVLPTALANSLLLAQCDTLLVAPILVAVAAAVRDRPKAMLGWFGAALAIKLQAIFLGPFVLAVLLARRVPIWWWPLPLLVVALLWLPAALAGWPPADLAFVYLKQTQWNRDFLNNAPGLWAFITAIAPGEAARLVVPGVVLAGIVGAGLAWWMRSLRNDPAAILAAATLSALALPFVMPRMHERYMFIADVLAAILAVALKSRRAIFAAVLLQAASILALVAYLLVMPNLLLVGAGACSAALAMTFAITRERLKIGANVAK